MKQLLCSITISALLLTGAAGNLLAQKTKPTAKPAPAGMVTDSSNWEFTAVQAMPQYGTPQYISANYTVTCTGKKLIVYLPYYGRATAGIDIYSGKGPLDFKSADFTIKKLKAKPGRWSISIRPNDYREVQSMDLTFYDDGTANLNVSLSNRSPISFTGTVAAIAANQQ